MSEEIEKPEMDDNNEASAEQNEAEQKKQEKKKIKNLAARAFESFEFLSEEKPTDEGSGTAELADSLSVAAASEEEASVSKESKRKKFGKSKKAKAVQVEAELESDDSLKASSMNEETVQAESLQGDETADHDLVEDIDPRAHLHQDEREALEEIEAREAAEAAEEENEFSEELPEYTAADVEGSELEAFESAEIEEKLFIEDAHAESIIESLLFASDKPVSMSTLRELFKDTNIEKAHIKRILERLAVEYAGAKRGVILEEVTGGFQLRTKVDNMNFLRRLLKGRSFKLSGPALEVLAIVAYKQPVIKAEIDEIRGVESGHLLRALMEKGLVNFEGKSELPGRPMQYATTKKFLEIFSLRNLKELPTLSQIDELLPEGIGAEEEKKEKLSDITDSMSQAITGTYSEGEEELEKIQSELQTVDTTTSFFEEEKKRMKDEENRQRAQDIREAVAVGEKVESKDLKWLAKYEAEQAALLAKAQELAAAAQVAANEASSADQNETQEEGSTDNDESDGQDESENIDESENQV